VSDTSGPAALHGAVDAGGRGLQPEMPVSLKPEHVGISAADLEASVLWYREMLGFSVDKVVDVPDDAGRVTLLSHGDFRLELFEIPGAAPLPDDRRFPDRDLSTHGIKHMAYAVPDVAAMTARLKSRGVEIAWDVTVHDGFTVAFVRDNSGNLVELVERPELW
jgi:methylmalonyl-CoA/ethylmalonyl-CoA epimerase